MKSIIKIIVLTVAVLFLFKSCVPFLSGPHPLVGQPAPDFILETVNGQEESMARFRTGHPALIFFWATWCPHCRTQLKELIQQYKEIEEKGIKVILVDLGESPEEVRAYADANNIPFNVFLDQDAAVGGIYSIIGVPTFFFLNKEGIVAAVGHELPGNYEEILFELTP